MSTDAKQLSALTFCACSVPAILLLTQLGWFWTAVCCVAVGILLALAKKSEQCRIIRIATLVWNLIALGAGADLLCRAFPDSSILIGLLLLLLAAFAADRGEHIMLRVGASAVFLLIILYGMLLGFSLPDVEISQFSIAQPKKWQAAAGALTPMLFLQKKSEKRSALLLLAAAVLAILAALVTAGRSDFYTAMMSVSVLGAMERLEPLVSVALTVGGFCLLGTICTRNAEMISDLFPNEKKFSMPINFFLGGACIWLSRLLGGTILAIGTAIFWGLLPILPQSLEKQKKFEKNEKNA